MVAKVSKIEIFLNSTLIPHYISPTLKDGDVIVNPDIKRFVTEQLLRGQGN